MKARVVTLGESEIRRKVAEEFEKKKSLVYESVIHDVLPQFMAVCMCELNKEFGFGDQRLKRFLSGVSSQFVIMECGILGTKYNPLDCLKYLNDRYDIDVDKEFSNESNV